MEVQGGNQWGSTSWPLPTTRVFLDTLYWEDTARSRKPWRRLGNGGPGRESVGFHQLAPSDHQSVSGHPVLGRHRTQPETLAPSRKWRSREGISGVPPVGPFRPP